MTECVVDCGGLSELQMLDTHQNYSSSTSVSKYVKQDIIKMKCSWRTCNVLISYAIFRLGVMLHYKSGKCSALLSVLSFIYYNQYLSCPANWCHSISVGPCTSNMM